MLNLACVSKRVREGVLFAPPLPPPDHANQNHGGSHSGYEKHRGYGKGGGGGGGGAYNIHKVGVELLLFPSADDFKQDSEEEYELEVVEESD